MMKTNVSNNLTQQLVNKLGSAIVQGRYTTEKSLPSEAEICQEFGISRTATREAVKMLSAKGLLVSRPRKGISIQEQQYWNMFDTDVLGWILNSTPSLTMLRDFTQLRLAIEPEAAALAANQVTRQGLLNIENALYRMKKAEEGLDDVLDADIAFHSSLLIASNNPFFIQLVDFIETALRVSIRYTNKIKGVSAASFNDHNDIFLAIASTNAEEARVASRQILLEALKLIDEQLTEL